VPQDPVREEAERLVAAALAAVNLATRGMTRAGGRGPIATGDPECCVCPVCRTIAAMRDPSSDLADRLASGAGDLATAVTSVLRTLSRPGGRRTGTDRDATREGDEFWESLRQRARAESGPGSTFDEPDVEPDDPWREATKYATPPPPPKPMAKKAVAKKAVANEAVAKKTAPAQKAAKATPPADAPAAKATPKKAPAKKAAKKAAPRPAGPEESA
jgi:hypothetical protein